MEEEVVHSSIERLLQYGVLGVFVIVFAVVIFFLWREGAKERKHAAEKLEKAQAEHLASLNALRVDFEARLERIWQLRLEDAKSYQTQFTELTKQSTTALIATTTMLEANKDMMADLKDSLKDLSDNIRTSRRPT